MVETARIAGTTELVDATDLNAWPRALVDATTFTCTGCSAPYGPVAIGPNMKRRPHFRISGEHRTGCDVAGNPVAGISGITLSTNSDDGYAGYPARLLLPDERPVVGTDSPAADPLPPRTRSDRPDHSAVATSRGTARTIRAIAKTFIAYPEMRRHLDLDIPGIGSTKYQFAFKRLPHHMIVDFPDLRVFHAPLRWSAPPERAGDRLIVTLHAGGVDTDRRIIHPYKLIIDQTGWTPERRRHTHDDAQHARSEARKAAQAGSTDRTWVFFVGQQTSSDNSEFIVRDHRLVSFITATLRYSMSR